MLPLVLVPLLGSRWQWCPIFELRWATLVWTILHDHRRPRCEIHSVHVAPSDLSLSTSAALFHSERINCECTDSFLKLMIKKKLSSSNYDPAKHPWDTTALIGQIIKSGRKKGEKRRRNEGEGLRTESSWYQKVERVYRKGERYVQWDCSHGDSRFWDALGRKKKV